MAGGTLMFNSQYKSLAAEWLGLSPDRLSIKDEPDVRTKESKQEHVPAPGKADKKKTIKVEQSFEIGEKLQRKLFKAKRRAYNRQKDETASVHDKSVGGEEEESRSESVKKKPRLEEGKDGNRLKPLTITELKTRLKDPTLSKPSRKKLRKRLRVLEEKDGPAPTHDGQKHGFKGPIAEKLHAKLQRKEIDEFSKSFSDHMKDYNNKKKKRKNSFSDKINKLKNTKQNQGNINTSDPTADQDDSESDAEETELGNQSPGKVRKSDMFLVDRSPVKKDNVQPSKKKTKKKTKSLHGGVTKDNETDTTKHKNTTAGGSSKIGVDNDSKATGRKRKRHKKRSKQKNIKKDHRPDEKKPAHLQGAGKNRVSQKLSSPQKSNSE